MNVLRRIIAPMGSMDAIEFINSKLKDTKSNAEFFNSMNKPVDKVFNFLAYPIFHFIRKTISEYLLIIFLSKIFFQLLFGS